jgi:phospholipid/cholesterol/gamma-HCH transport system substrate-binding protein
MRLAAGLLALAGAALWVTGGDAGHPLSARFGDVRGLVDGAPVRIAGLPAGEVTEIALDEHGMPVVRMRLDAPLHEGARAAVRLASLSGENNRYVALADGAGPELADGAVLALADTRSPVEFDEALQALGPRERADLKAVLGGLRAATAGRGEALAVTLERSARTLAGAADAARQVTADGPALRTLVRASAQVSSALADGRGRLGAAARSVSELLHTTATESAAVGATVAALPGAFDGAGAALAETRRAIAPLRALVRAARPGLGELAGASRELDPLLAGARPVLARARLLAAHAPDDLRALSGLVAHARPLLGALGPVLERMGPILDESRVRLPDLFSFFSNWADFTSSYDANGHGARVGIVLSPAPTATLAPDTNGAGQLAVPYLRTPGALEGEPWRDYADSFVAGAAP